ncbi:AAA family ATPase [Alkalitalea saponilacus]|uniref:Nicotinamide riboside kinase n=1 Tax=Alkalitalea saponilacus TaxID=889453 RepID=A0A1T5HAD5_9BACT|nr:ATP-binding protein [Alkalitalea saponilacus]ASB50808.1 ATPase [Alkalitalea saponilacus]SKC17529.1 Nicotinamide riboside kinase [Alkalitalea saponilacus]
MLSVVISGPEASGKSTLSNQLADAFNGLAIPEYARDYVSRLNRKYTFSDVETIARRQIFVYKKLQNSYRGDNLPVFFDTFLIITKVWFEDVFGCCPVWLHKEILQTKPDLVLLCFPDLDWNDDGVRENGNRRDYFYNCYVESLEYYEIPWFKIYGQGDTRKELAIKILNRFLTKPQIK